MSKKFPDTIASWQHTTAADVPSDNIFNPDIRVQLSWSDIEDAVERGAIIPSEAHALWALWASSDSPQRVLPQKTVVTGDSPVPRSKPGSSLFGMFA